MREATTALGAAVLSGGGVRFRVWAPFARRVDVVFPRRRGEQRLEPAEPGYFVGVASAASAGSDYLYRLDERAERPDPASRHQPDGVHGASRVAGPDFAWTDAAWRGVAQPDLVFYELHVGTFSAEGTFDAVIPHLAALRDLGVTAVELMPVAQFPGTRNWGYDGVFPYAPQQSYGGPDGLRRLVDAAHAAGLAVVLDVVYNHLGPEGNVLGDFGPYFTDRYRTPWGSALNFDGPDSDEVRRYFLENALYWIGDFHLDGLRLDAVHAIHDESATPFLLELGEAVHGLGQRLDRRVHLVAESDANDPRLVRDADAGGLGLDAVWSDDFHHAVHAALTGERDGYYTDFGDIEQIAEAMAKRFVYDGGYSRHRRRRHGAPAAQLPPERFVFCIQNHDQVGNRAAGERLSTLLPPARLRLAAALLLLSQSLPLLFMGEEYGEQNPFLYFVDHGDPDLVEAVRRGRRAEFAAFAERSEVPDPADAASFIRSRLDRDRGDSGMLALYRELLQLRGELAALRDAAAIQVQADTDAGWIRATYALRGAPRAFAAFHLGPEKAELPRAPAGPWSLRLATDDARFGGPGTTAPARLEAGTQLVLPPEAALLYAREAA